MIRLENISKTYRLGSETVRALDQVNLRIQPREYAAIVGPSGSGKSTLMHILGCLDNPTSGRYFLDGQDVSALSEGQLAQVRGQKIGFVFQGFQLLPRLTALENVALPLMLQGISKTQRLSRAQDALEQVGLEKRLHHKPSQLSGGQQQRVAVARALIHHPSVILADEPTGNLDQKATREVLSLLEALHRQGHTLVVITHDPSVARQAPRQILVEQGQLKEAPADSTFPQPPLFPSTPG
ncbi:MAG: ABC transporter ATP-binding protein [Clostridia bacterium]|nr:ABC transporter ATP-binding protein [Clostridia bacterium]